MALGLGKVVVFAVILCEEAMPSFIFVVVPLVMIFVFPVVNILRSGDSNDCYGRDEGTSQKQ